MVLVVVTRQGQRIRAGSMAGGRRSGWSCAEESVRWLAARFRFPKDGKGFSTEAFRPENRTEAMPEVQGGSRNFLFEIPRKFLFLG